MIKLYEHQKIIMDKLKNFNRCAMYLDMGLGKTFTGSEKVKELGCDTNLIIVQKSKIEDWISHFEQFYDYEVYNLRLKSQMEGYMNSNCKKVGIINYELAFRRPELLKLSNFTLMLDESSYIKNEKAKRTKFILKLGNICDNVILLSGTPVSGKYEELWSQLRLLGWNISKRAFYNNYIITRRIDVGGFPIDYVVGYKNISHLKRKCAEYGAVFMLTDEAIKLPEAFDNIVKVKRHSKYSKFIKDEYIKIGDIELIGDNTLTKMLYSRQLCGIYNKDKVNAYLDLINSSNDRFIVFYNFTKELEILKSVTDRPISIVNGKLRDLRAYENDSNSITFIQYQAGSKGLNLQKANKTIYFTPPLSVENFMQSKKRTLRLKQERPCYYYYLIADKTIEDKIYKALNKGEDYTLRLFAN